MKLKNKKGVGLVMAIMIVTVLVIMGAGFFHVTNYATQDMRNSTEKLKLYWATESAANFNMNWWANLEDVQRKDFPSYYMPPGGGGTVGKEGGEDEWPVGCWKDVDYLLTNSEKEDGFFPGGEDIAENDKIWLHPASNVEGYLDSYSGNGINGYMMYLNKWKGERLDNLGEAVWILDNIAIKDNKQVCRITYANVYNVNLGPTSPFFNQSEAIVNTQFGTGFNGRKGFFAQWDYRYGNAYYADIVKYDYKNTGGDSEGPSFYGLPTTQVISAADEISNYVIGNSVNGTDFMDTMGEFYMGIRVNGATGESDCYDFLTDSFHQDDETMAIDFDWGADPFDTDNVIWPWEVYEEPSNAEELGIYNIAHQFSVNEVPLGSNIGVELKIDIPGQDPGTYAVISFGSKDPTTAIDTVRIDEIGKGKQLIAVGDEYGFVNFNGISNADISVVTESSSVNIVGDLWLEDMTDTKDWLENQEGDLMNTLEGRDRDTDDLLENMYQSMLETNPAGHIGVLSCIGSQFDPSMIPSRLNTINLESEELLFTTAHFLCVNGALSSDEGQSHNTMLKFFNIGSVITLATQDTDEGGESAKYPFVLIQDARYDNDEEEGPPGTGASPDAIISESLHGINPRARWNMNYDSMESSVIQQAFGNFIGGDY